MAILMHGPEDFLLVLEPLQPTQNFAELIPGGHRLNSQFT
jgi:hypothetical protein